MLASDSNPSPVTSSPDVITVCSIISRLTVVFGAWKAGRQCMNFTFGLPLLSISVRFTWSDAVARSPHVRPWVLHGHWQSAAHERVPTKRDNYSHEMPPLATVTCHPTARITREGCTRTGSLRWTIYPVSIATSEIQASPG